jgi:hypothetical protein
MRHDRDAREHPSPHPKRIAARTLINRTPPDRSAAAARLGNAHGKRAVALRFPLVQSLRDPRVDHRAIRAIDPPRDRLDFVAQRHLIGI